MKDPVNIPPHYTYSKIEVLDAIEEWDLPYNLGNVVKYVARADHKGQPLQDLRKAAAYLKRYIAILEGHPFRNMASVPEKQSLVYLASPYTHKDPDIEAMRFEQVTEAASILSERGHLIFCPISHSHPMRQYGLNGTWEFWEELDRRMMDACDECWVLTLDEWGRSPGVQHECLHFAHAGKPVSYYALETIRNPKPGTIVGKRYAERTVEGDDE